MLIPDLASSHQWRDGFMPPWDRNVLDFVPWHLDPPPVDKHLQTICDEPVGSKLTVPVIAAARARRIPQMRVDVMSLGWQRQAGEENN